MSMIACQKMPSVWKDIIILAFVALIARLPGLFWGIDFYSGGEPVLFHEDERSFAGHLLEYLNRGTIGRQDYVLGFGFLSILFVKASSLFIKDGGLLQPFTAVVIVRAMNILFGVGTVILTYLLARTLSLRRLAACFAALFLALSPLHVTESHCAAPGVSFVFFCYLAFICLLAWSAHRYLWWIACAASGIAVAIKFGLLAVLPVIFIMCTERRLSWQDKGRGFILLLAAFFLFNMGRIVPLSPEGLSLAVHDNFQERQYNRLWNPLVYSLDIILGMSACVSLLALLGWFVLLRKGFYDLVKKENICRFCCLELPLLVQAAAVCLLSSNFPRHVLVFLPYVSILSGVGTEAIFRVLKKRTSVGIFACLATAFVIYQVIVVAHVERGYLLDPKFEDRRWLVSHMKPGSGVWSDTLPEEYFNIQGKGHLVKAPPQADYVILDGSARTRFERSFLNPGSVRPEPQEIYHWNLTREPQFVRSTLAGENEFRPLLIFDNQEFLPEYFLSRETFGGLFWLSDGVNIYKRSNKISAPVQGRDDNRK